MRALTLASRTFKEILRDPLNLSFGLGFPLVLLIIMSIIQKNIPVSIFEIGHLTPGIVVFGLSFFTLFCGNIVAKDRESALLTRLYTTPLRATDFILGYTLPFFPMALAQCLICYIVALIMGLNVTISLLYAILAIMPIALFFIALGVLCGSVMNTKQVGGFCGALVTNITAILSGIFFDIGLMGKGFETFAYLLPFANAVALERNILNATYVNTIWNFLWVMGYGILFLVGAVLLFLRQMKRQ